MNKIIATALMLALTLVSVGCMPSKRNTKDAKEKPKAEAVVTGSSPRELVQSIAKVVNEQRSEKDKELWEVFAILPPHTNSNYFAYSAAYNIDVLRPLEPQAPGAPPSAVFEKDLESLRAVVQKLFQLSFENLKVSAVNVYILFRPSGSFMVYTLSRSAYAEIGKSISWPEVFDQPTFNISLGEIQEVFDQLHGLRMQMENLIKELEKKSSSPQPAPAVTPSKPQKP